jgi:hypothetical protein
VPLNSVDIATLEKEGRSSGNDTLSFDPILEPGNIATYRSIIDK